MKWQKGLDTQNPLVVLICWPITLIMLIIFTLPCKCKMCCTEEDAATEKVAFDPSLCAPCCIFHLYSLVLWQQSAGRVTGTKIIQILLNPLIFLILKHTFHSFWGDAHNFPFWITMRETVWSCVVFNSPLGMHFLGKSAKWGDRLIFHFFFRKIPLLNLFWSKIYTL